jgi:predicted metal-binding membrane protein
VSRVLGLTLGIVTALGGFVDIGELVFASQAGARFQYSLLWPVVLGALAIIVFSEMSGRVAIVSKKAAFTLVREHLGYSLGFCALGASTVVNALTCAAEVGGVAIILRLLTHLPFGIAAAIAIAVIIAVISALPFENLERLFGFMGLLMLVFVAGWLVMLVAMMLPTTLPLVTLFHRLTMARPDRSRLLGLLLVGYLGVWLLFGMGVYLGDGLLHELGSRSTWLAEHSWALGGLSVLLAGAYQFTPLKYHCLDKCRSPFGFLTQHWRGRDAAGQAFLLGVHHGVFCVGCCWSLMLVMFAVGVGNLGWMLALGALMAVEKNLPRGRRLSAPLGALLLLWGLGLLLGTMPPAFGGLG